MKTQTDHHSFILKPSMVHIGGVGVFALHDIAEGTHVAVFPEKIDEELVEGKNVPSELRGFCLDREDGNLLCPRDFSHMEIGHYLNHSENANLHWEEGKGYFAIRDIKAGEELLANYLELGEPESSRESYVK